MIAYLFVSTTIDCKLCESRDFLLFTFVALGTSIVPGDRDLILIFIPIILKIDTRFLGQGQVITYSNNLRQESLRL